MVQSLQFRINLISLLSGVLIATGLVLAGWRVIALHVNEEFQTHAQIAAQDLVNSVQRMKALGFTFDAFLGLDEECREVVRQDEFLLYAGIYDLQGRLRFSSGGADIGWPGAREDAENFQVTQRDNYLFFAQPIEEYSDSNEGFVVIVADLALAQRKIWEMVTRFVVLAGVLVIVGLGLHFLWLRRSVIMPLRLLVKEVKAVDPSNFQGRLNRVDIGRGEIGELATVFSKLLSELSKAQQEGMKQASRILKAEKQLNKTIMQSSPLAIYTRDRQGMLTGWNAACERLFGWTEEEVLGQPLPTIPLDKLDESADMRQQLLQGHPNLQIEAQRMRRDGSMVELLITLSPLYDENGEIEGVLAIAADITERKVAERHIEFLAHHDALTGLPNRRLIQARFEQVAAFADCEGKKVGMVYFDLDHFKAINDSFGHGGGDIYLKEIARRLSGTVRSSDILSRQGGDEFLIVLASLNGAEDILPVLDKLREKMKEPVLVGNKGIVVSMSVGVALYPDDGSDFEELQRKADAAMYQAKNAGRNTYGFYGGHPSQAKLHCS